jgi:hypothetical protein
MKQRRRKARSKLAGHEEIARTSEKADLSVTRILSQSGRGQEG